MKRRAGVASVVGLAGVAGAVVVLAFACSAAPDIVPFPCAIVILGGDGGDGADSSGPTAYFLARQITPADCAQANISWIQCTGGIDARYSAVLAVDGGPVTIDYFTVATGARLAEVVYPTINGNGSCIEGPNTFAPPFCGGAQVVCCPYNPDAGDGGDAGDAGDAGPDSGCGF